MEKVQSIDNVSLEDALERTGFGMSNWILIVLSGAILGAVFMETVSINVILPVAQCELQMTNQHKGLLSAIGFIGVIVSSHLWGFLSDTRGRKKIIAASLFVSFALSIISSMIKSYWLMVAFRFLTGFL